MLEQDQPSVAIVDYGLGNLFSVKRACESVGMQALITSTRSDLLSADAVILPGVGAFGAAMGALEKLDLVEVLHDVASSTKPLVGICLGMQLLMSESYEFGRHEGLGLIPGPVVRLENPKDGLRKLKVPQVGWNRISGGESGESPSAGGWTNTALDGLADKEFMYFVHSFVVQPEDPGVVLSTTRYGHVEFCSSLKWRNIFACQFHPERSGRQGLKIYHNLARLIRNSALGAAK